MLKGWLARQNDERDPWTGKPRSDQAGPPNLDEALNQLKKHLQKLLNRPTSSGGGSSSSKFSDLDKKAWQRGLSVGFGAVFVLWILSGIFIVDVAERGVVLRFGRYIETVGPGPHWIPSLIERVYVVNEEKISNYTYQAPMLTKDANLVDVTLAIQYRVDDAKNYLFNVLMPEESLKQATASALRQVVGNTSLDDVLTSGRETVRQQVKETLVHTLERYQSGLLVTDVAVQNAAPPEAVKEAFDDAIKAQEDEKRFQNQAQAYANQVEPIAKGQAQRLLADANGYKQQVVLRAKGDVASYLSLLPAYQQATQVTRDRLYLDTMETVLNNTSKILVDTKSGQGSMFYLPLDKWLDKNAGNNAPANIVPPMAPSPTEAANNGKGANETNSSGYSAGGGY